MLENLDTEQRNAKTMELDQLEVEAILRIMNEEDATIPLAIREALPDISAVVAQCIITVERNGKIFYVGAGTSGRLAMIDAVETIPTFNAPADLFVPIMAGGIHAAFQSKEGVEDDAGKGETEILERGVTTQDFVIGITASGRTPFVRGALKKAQEIGCKTALICNVKKPANDVYADFSIRVVTGAEVLTGSTRLKAGSAQKMVLNMISTATMVKTGKVYQNLMVDVLVLNEKLQQRAIRIVAQATGETHTEKVKEALHQSGWNAKQAILQLVLKIPPQQAKAILQTHAGHLRKALSQGNLADTHTVGKA